MNMNERFVAIIRDLDEAIEAFAKLCATKEIKHSILIGQVLVVAQAGVRRAYGLFNGG